MFNLVYHGNGGFTHERVYSMPIWLRRFYVNKIIEFKKASEKANSKPHNSQPKGPAIH